MPKFAKLLHILKTIEFESQQCLKKGVLELKPVCWTKYVPDAAARARRSGIYRAGSYRRAPAKPDTQSRNCPGPTSAAETLADIGLRRGMRCAEIFPFAFRRATVQNALIILIFLNIRVIHS